MFLGPIVWLKVFLSPHGALSLLICHEYLIYVCWCPVCSSAFQRYPIPPGRPCLARAYTKTFPCFLVLFTEKHEVEKENSGGVLIKEPMGLSSLRAPLGVPSSPFSSDTRQRVCFSFFGREFYPPNPRNCSTHKNTKAWRNSVVCKTPWRRSVTRVALFSRAWPSPFPWIKFPVYTATVGAVIPLFLTKKKVWKPTSRTKSVSSLSSCATLFDRSALYERKFSRFSGVWLTARGWNK